MLRNRVIWTCLLLSLLLHLAGLFLTRDLWMDELDAESFRARIARIPPQFKPRRLSAVPRQETDAPKVEMEYMRTEAPEAAACVRCGGRRAGAGRALACLPSVCSSAQNPTRNPNQH